MQEQLGFYNANGWREQVHRIPWGVRDDRVYLANFTTSSVVDGIISKEYTIYHRDGLSVVCFLLGYEAFLNNLNYAPIQLRTADDARVYNEMHTGDWWWQT